jgi:hypothetical protein
MTASASSPQARRALDGLEPPRRGLCVSVPDDRRGGRGLNVGRALIDGEAVVFKDYGGSDFGALMTKRGGEQAVLVAFDLLRLVGVDEPTPGF